MLTIRPPPPLKVTKSLRILLFTAAQPEGHCAAQAEAARLVQGGFRSVLKLDREVRLVREAARPVAEPDAEADERVRLHQEVGQHRSAQATAAGEAEGLGGADQVERRQGLEIGALTFVPTTRFPEGNAPRDLA